MQYVCLRNILTNYIFVDVTSIVIVYYVADCIDYFSMPHGIQEAIEHRHCKKQIDGEKYITTLFSHEHGLLDSPAVEHLGSYSMKLWKKCGNKHRDDDKPAYVYIDRSSKIEKWFVHGKPARHRAKDPHALDSNGIMWWLNDMGQVHRENDLPAYIRMNGSARWYRDNKLHRECGPAVIRANGEEEWYKNGLRFEDGNFNIILLNQWSES